MNRKENFIRFLNEATLRKLSKVHSNNYGKRMKVEDI